MPVKGKHLLHYVPHGINSDLFKPLDKTKDPLYKKLKKEFFGEDDYNFVVSFNSRNAHRKHPSNLIIAFRSFCDSLPPEESSKCALIMHTEKVSDAGTDLKSVVNALCSKYKVVIDESKRTPEEMVAFYNLADVTANVSSNEGFGLSIAESIMCGTPVVAVVTGGLQDQLGIVDDEGKPVEFDLKFGTNSTGRHKKHGVWAKPVWTRVQNMQGSPPTPYIIDDLTDYSDIADAIGYWYVLGAEKRTIYGLEGRRWAINEGGINSKNMCDQFIKAMDYTLNNFEPVKRFDSYTFESYDCDIKNQPRGEMGFEFHKVNFEEIKKELV